MEANNIASDIFNILRGALPSEAYMNVEVVRPIGRPLIRITIAGSDKLINNMEGQYPQRVMLTLSLDELELKSNLNKVYRRPREGTKETFYAMVGEKVPFRRPQPELPKIYKTIETFTKRYMDKLREFKDELMYTDMINYDSLLK